MKVNGDIGAFLPTAQRNDKGRSDAPSFASVLSNSIKDPEPGDKSLGYGREEARRLARQDPTYADAIMKSFINDIGGPLIDVSDPEAIRFTVSGELVTRESMIYYQEQNRLAKQGYLDIYEEGRKQGASSEQTFEKFMDFNSSLPLRYKQMANIWF